MSFLDDLINNIGSGVNHLFNPQQPQPQRPAPQQQNLPVQGIPQATWNRMNPQAQQNLMRSQQMMIQGQHDAFSPGGVIGTIGQATDTVGKNLGNFAFNGTAKLINQGLGVVENAGANGIGGLQSMINHNNSGDALINSVKQHVDSQLLAPGKGLFGAGGVYNSSDALHNASPSDVFTRAGGTALQSVAERFAPKGASAVIKGASPVFSRFMQGVGTGLGTAAAYSTGNQLSNTGQVDPNQLAFDTALGGIIGGGAPLAIDGAKALANAPRAAAHAKLVQTNPQYAALSNQATDLANKIGAAQSAGIPQTSLQPHIDQLNGMVNQLTRKQDLAMQYQAGHIQIPGGDKAQNNIKLSSTPKENGILHQAILPDGTSGMDVMEYPNRLSIVNANIKNEALRGQGLGKQMYNQMIDLSNKTGKPLVSDTTVEKPAVRVWQSLKNSGHNVIENPNALQLEDGTKYMPGLKEPVYTLAPNKSPVPPVQPKSVPNSLTKKAQQGKQNISPEVQQGIDGSHTIRNTQALQDQAIANADKAGLDHTIASAHDALNVPMGKIDDQTVAHVQQAIERADAAGRTKDAIDLHDALSEHLTKQGQTIQAASLLYRMSPQGQFYKAVRDIKKSGQDVSPALETKLKGLTDAIKNAKDQNAKDTAIATFHKAVADSLPQGKAQSLVSVWKAGLLSGPITHAGNAASNATFGALKKISDVPATAVDTGLAALGKTPLGKKIGLTGERTKTFTMQGVGSGAKQGLGTAKQTLTTGIDLRNLSGNKYEAHGELNFKNPVINAIFGKTSNAVFRAMSAGDQPFYYAAAKNSLYDQALALGKNQKLSGEQLQKFAQNMVNNPSKKMAEQAKKDAEYAVLSQDSKIGSAVSKFTQAHPALQVVVPFTKVPTNFLSETLDYTPVGAIKNVIEQVKNIKNGQGIDQRSFSEAIGRSATGTGIMVLGSALASGNLLSGQYPSNDQKEAARWKAEGIQPNSVKIGNTWYSLNYLGPAGMLLQAGKDWNDAAARGDQQAMAAITGFGKSLTGQSFLTGFSGVANALQDPQRFGANFINSQAGSVVPNWLNQVAQAFDPQQRQADTPAQTIQSRIPGAREALNPKQDVYGNPLDTRTDPLNMLTNPLRPSNANNSPVIDEVARLHQSNPNDKNLQVTPTPVNPTISLGNGNNIKLSKGQQYQLQTAVGQATQNQWGKLMQTPQYQAANDTEKADMLSKLRTNVEQAATRQFVAQNSLGQYAKGPSAKVTSLMNGNGDVAALSASSKNGTTINSGLDKGSQDILTKYNAMSAADRQKFFTSSNDAEYKYQLAKYQNDKANGTISDIQDISRQKDLAKAQIGASVSKDARDLYGMSKSAIYQYLTTHDNGNQLAQELQNYDQALHDAGVTSSLKFKTGMAPAKSGGSRGGGRRSSGGTGGTKTAKAGIAAFNKSVKSNISTTNSVNQKVASAKVASVSKRSLPTMKKSSGITAYKKPKTTNVSMTRKA